MTVFCVKSSRKLEGHQKRQPLLMSPIAALCRIYPQMSVEKYEELFNISHPVQRSVTQGRDKRQPVADEVRIILKCGHTDFVRALKSTLPFRLNTTLQRKLFITEN